MISVADVISALGGGGGESFLSNNDVSQCIDDDVPQMH